MYDADSVRGAFTRVRNSTPYSPLKMHYACVTNANIAILRLIRALGGGIHANTWGDAVIAMSAGTSGRSFTAAATSTRRTW